MTFPGKLAPTATARLGAGAGPYNIAWSHSPDLVSRQHT